VVFPKIYYPNREIPVSATVTVVSAGKSNTITVQQETLTSKGFGATGIQDGWGGLNVSYNEAYMAALRAIPNYKLLRTNTNAAVPTGTTYLHASNFALPINFDWTHVNDFRRGTDGLTHIGADDYTAGGPLVSLNSATSPLKMAGYTIVAGTTGGWQNDYGMLNRAVSGTKIYQFLMDKGNNPINAILSTINLQEGAFYSLDNNTNASEIPKTGVPIIVKANNADRATMVIDPANRLIFLGEGQHFWLQDNSWQGGNRDKFLDNLMYYVSNAAKYGSHFMDMFIEEPDPRAVPAPWDE
jgi:hypothetical protein